MPSLCGSLQILPIGADLPSRLVKLAEAGVVEWNGQPVPPYEPKTVNQGKQLLSELIAEDRE